MHSAITTISRRHRAKPPYRGAAPSPAVQQQTQPPERRHNANAGALNVSPSSARICCSLGAERRGARLKGRPSGRQGLHPDGRSTACRSNRGCIGPWWPWGLASQRWGSHLERRAVGRTERSQGLTSQLRPIGSMLDTSINESQNQHDSLLDALQSIFGRHRTLANFISQLRQPVIADLTLYVCARTYTVRRFAKEGR